MPRWTSITPDDLKAAGHGAIMDSAQTLAVGDVDPVADAIADSVARVRLAVSAANVLDTDTTKVPKSLKGMVVLMALFALMQRIGLALSEDQRAARKEGNDDLKLLAARKVRVELADDPDTATTPPNPGEWNSENKIVMRTHPVPRPGNQFTPQTNTYANPDAAADTEADA